MFFGALSRNWKWLQWLNGIYFCQPLSSELWFLNPDNSQIYVFGQISAEAPDSGTQLPAGLLSPREEVMNVSEKEEERRHWGGRRGQSRCCLGVLGLCPRSGVMGRRQKPQIGWGPVLRTYGLTFCFQKHPTWWGGRSAAQWREVRIGSEMALLAPHSGKSLMSPWGKQMLRGPVVLTEAWLRTRRPQEQWPYDQSK